MIDKERVFENAMDYIQRIDCNAYCGPSAEDSDITIIVTNWNNMPSKFQDWIEDYFGDYVETLYEDEATTCSHCGDIISTTPQTYGHQVSYFVVPEWGEVLCRKCLENDESLCEDTIEVMHDQTVFPAWFKGCLTGWIEESELFKAPKEYETGFHPGQNDNLKDALKQAATRHELLTIAVVTTASQFDVYWELLVKYPFADSSLQPEVVEGPWWYCDGYEPIPAEYTTKGMYCSENGIVEPDKVELYHGYGGRMMMPGYMDCTEWVFADDYNVVICELIRLYGDES